MGPAMVWALTCTEWRSGWAAPDIPKTKKLDQLNLNLVSPTRFNAE
jgi:hypothetical protein